MDFKTRSKLVLTRSLHGLVVWSHATDLTSLANTRNIILSATTQNKRCFLATFNSTVASFRHLVPAAGSSSWCDIRSRSPTWCRPVVLRLTVLYNHAVLVAIAVKVTLDNTPLLEQACLGNQHILQNTIVRVTNFLYSPISARARLGLVLLLALRC